MKVREYEVSALTLRQSKIEYVWSVKAFSSSEQICSDMPALMNFHTIHCFARYQH